MHRRELLRGTLTTGLLARATRAISDGSQPTAGLTLGFSTYGAKSLTTERAIDLLAEIGFDSIELTIWPQWDADPAALKPHRRASLRKKLNSRGLRLTSLMEHLHIDEKDRTRHARIERVKLAAGLAHDLSPHDPPLMQTTIGGGGRWQQMRNRYADELADWIKVADREDLVIAVKPHRGGAFSRPDEAAELMNLLDKPKRLRMCYDFAHYDFREMTLEDTIRTSLPHVAHVAVKDVVKANGQMRFVLPGASGRIDYPHMLRLLHEGKYRGDICCEVSSQVWSQSDYDPIESVKTCYAHLSAAFETSGVPRAQHG